MTQWYYADRQRRQLGPLPATEIARLFRAGEVDAATLVWRDGMAAWQPLGTMRAELGLDEAPPPTLDFRAAPEPVPAAAAGSPAGVEAIPPVPQVPAHAGSGGHAGYTYAAAAATVDADDVVHAGLWRRFAASVLDGFITGIISYALLIPLMLVFGLSMSNLASGGFAETGMSVGFLTLNYAISFGVPALYFAWMHSSSSQASLGKMAVGVKVVRGNGDPVGFGRALLRYVAYLVFAIFTCGVGVLVSGLMVAFTQRKQALHDMLCDTLVVDRYAFTAQPQMQKRGLDTVTVVVLVIFGLLMVLGIIAMVAFIGMLSSMRWH